MKMTRLIEDYVSDFNNVTFSFLIHVTPSEETKEYYKINIIFYYNTTPVYKTHIYLYKKELEEKYLDYKIDLHYIITDTVFLKMEEELVYEFYVNMITK